MPGNRLRNVFVDDGPTEPPDHFPGIGSTVYGKRFKETVSKEILSGTVLMNLHTELCRIRFWETDLRKARMDGVEELEDRTISSSTVLGNHLNIKFNMTVRRNCLTSVS